MGWATRPLLLLGPGALAGRAGPERAGRPASRAGAVRCRAYMPMMVRTVASRWEGAILVCGKCSKRVGGGFGKKGRTSLAKMLRALGLGGPGRKAAHGVIETKCLKLCPKGAIVAVDLRSPGRWLLVPPGASEEALRRLFAGDGGQAGKG